MLSTAPLAPGIYILGAQALCDGFLYERCDPRIEIVSERDLLSVIRGV